MVTSTQITRGIAQLKLKNKTVYIKILVTLIHSHLLDTSLTYLKKQS